MTTHPKLSAIKQRLAAATKSPWQLTSGNRIFGAGDIIEPYDCDWENDKKTNLIVETDSGVYPPNDADAQLIANAPNDLHLLIEALECAMTAIDTAGCECGYDYAGKIEGDCFVCMAKSAVARILGDDGDSK